MTRRTIGAALGAATLPACAVVASLAFDLLVLDRGIVLEDEGATVAIAARIARGEVLYRDAPINLGPLVYELFALIFRATGPSFLVARVVVALASAATAAIVAVAARRAGAGASAWIAPALFVLLRPLAFPQWHIAYYSPVAMTLALAAVVALLGAPSSAVAAAAGLLAGSAFVAKQNYGALALLGGLVVLGLGVGGAAVRTRRAAAFLACAPLPLAAIAALFAARGALAELGHGMFVFAIQAQGGTFVVPRPPLLPTLAPDEVFRRGFLYYVPPLVWELGFPAIGETWLWKSTGIVELLLKAGFVVPPLVPLLLLARAGRSTQPAEARGLAAVALTFALLASYPTWDWGHQVYAVVAALPCAAVLLARAVPRRIAAVLLGLAALPALALTLGARQRFDARIPGLDVRGTPELARAVGETCDLLAAQGATRCLVVPYQPALYLACGVENPTPLDIFLPGFVDEASRARVHAALDQGVPVVRFTKEYGHLPRFEATYPDIVARLVEPPFAEVAGPGFRIFLHRPRAAP